jgi:hypothetical protein
MTFLSALLTRKSAQLTHMQQLKKALMKAEFETAHELILDPKTTWYDQNQSVFVWVFQAAAKYQKDQHTQQLKGLMADLISHGHSLGFITRDMLQQARVKATLFSESALVFNDSNSKLITTEMRAIIRATENYFSEVINKVNKPTLGAADMQALKTTTEQLANSKSGGNPHQQLLASVYHSALLSVVNPAPQPKK